MTEREQGSVRPRPGPTRCPYCHEECAVEEACACAACLSRHHQRCWEEGGGCSSCRADRRLEPRSPRPPGAEHAYERAIDGWIKLAAFYNVFLFVENLCLMKGHLEVGPVTPWPEGDYLVHVSRAWTRPRGDAFAWNLRDELPEIPIPLAKGETEATLDLAQVVRTTYERARYDLVIDYTRAADPPLSTEAAAWVRSLLPI